ncbi:uncharacterized protein TNCV_5112611 [Trichonephila clavipes]|nr:uncharacterized protein TNCV_5112611 [Trichonephila clavipes]
MRNGLALPFRVSPPANVFTGIQRSGSSMRETYQPGEHVFVASHPLSNAAQGRSAKLLPCRDGPYVILTQRSPSSYEIAGLDNPGEPLGVYHTSALTPCNNDKVKPFIHLRKRGRPPKVPQTPDSSSGRLRNQRGRM